MLGFYNPNIRTQLDRARRIKPNGSFNEGLFDARNRALNREQSAEMLAGDASNLMQQAQRFAPPPSNQWLGGAVNRNRIIQNNLSKRKEDMDDKRMREFNERRLNLDAEQAQNANLLGWANVALNQRRTEADTEHNAANLGLGYYQTNTQAMTQAERNAMDAAQLGQRTMSNQATLAQKETIEKNRLEQKKSEAEAKNKIETAKLNKPARPIPWDTRYFDALIKKYKSQGMTDDDATFQAGELLMKRNDPQNFKDAFPPDTSGQPMGLVRPPVNDGATSATMQTARPPANMMPFIPPQLSPSQPEFMPGPTATVTPAAPVAMPGLKPPMSAVQPSLPARDAAPPGAVGYAYDEDTGKYGWQMADGTIQWIQ